MISEATKQALLQAGLFVPDTVAVTVEVADVVVEQDIMENTEAWDRLLKMSDENAECGMNGRERRKLRVELSCEQMIEDVTKWTNRRQWTNGYPHKTSNQKVS